MSYACKDGYLDPVLEILRWHRDRNHDSCLQSEKGQTALHLAVEFGHPTLVTEILKDSLAPVNTPDRAGWIPLHTAAKRGDVAIINILLEHAVVLDSTTDEGKNALHIAAQYGHAAICELLWERAPDSLRNAKTKGGLLPASLAVKHGHVGAVKILLHHKADPNIMNKKGSTPIFFSAEMGKVKVVIALLKAGAKASSRNNSNTTPLHRAAGNGHADCIKILMEFLPDNNAKAILEVKNSYGSTPL
ncbi:ankyrin repeat-containing domain protein, partial [Bombardia bombarda]